MTIYAITGMHCGSCVERIERAVRDVHGVTDVAVSLERSELVVMGTPEPDAVVVARAVESAGSYLVKPSTAEGPEVRTLRRLYPLLLIVTFILGTTILIAASTGVWDPAVVMRHFMAGFFLVFSFFKLLDLRGFVGSYRRYDLLAARLPLWGWAYPFVELGLGIGYVLGFAPEVLNGTVILLMLFGAIGVFRTLRAGKRIRCACLGTVLDLPMTTVTLVENLTMVAMASAMLILK
ncbi:MAG: MauE/DoxX family redox-associated membrane protein [Planctomycetota bacterium]